MWALIMLLGGQVAASRAGEIAVGDGYVKFGRVSSYDGNHQGNPEIEFFVPALKTDDSVIYADFRAVVDASFEENVSLGVGYRKWHSSGVVLGVNYARDKRSLDSGIAYSQDVFGLEAFLNGYDVRANLYVPSSDGKNLVSTRRSQEVHFSGDQFYFDVLEKRVYEKSMNGFDFILDVDLYHDDSNTLDVTFKYFNFDEGDMNEREGGRIGLRYERAFKALGRDLKLGIEAGHSLQSDFDEDSYFTASLQMRFGAGGPSSTSKLKKSLYEPTSRNYFPVTGLEAHDYQYRSPAQITIGAHTYDRISSRVDNASDISFVLDAAGEDSLVYMNGERGGFIINEVLDVLDGQTLAGGGTIVLLTGGRGERAMATLPGEESIIVSNGANGIRLNGSATLVNVSQVYLTDSIELVDNLVFNHSFENGHSVPSGQSRVFFSIPGWSRNGGYSDAPFEIQNGVVFPAIDGDSVLGLDVQRGAGFVDSNASAFQDISTHQYLPYHIVFNYSSSVDNNFDTNRVDVLWEGSKVAELNGFIRGWQVIDMLVYAASETGSSRLEFRGVGAEDSQGGLIDNVRIEEVR